jgi:flagellar basal-body rod protein FlgC
MDDLQKSTLTAISGMTAQAERLRVISENLANADSLAQSPGGLPYRRQVVTFKDVLNHSTGVDKVEVAHVQPDMSQFQRRYDPHNPAADRNGYVLAPNVNSLVELMDMREAQRSYQANLDVVSTSRSMLQQTVQLLR